MPIQKKGHQGKEPVLDLTVLNISTSGGSLSSGGEDGSGSIRMKDYGAEAIKAARKTSETSESMPWVV